MFVSWLEMAGVHKNKTGPLFGHVGTKLKAEISAEHMSDIRASGPHHAEKSANQAEVVRQRSRLREAPASQKRRIRKSTGNLPEQASPAEPFESTGSIESLPHQLSQIRVPHHMEFPPEGSHGSIDSDNQIQSCAALQKPSLRQHNNPMQAAVGQ
tara:strand:- start:1733 stop:2197 length:465 start_codon:yes stop_codon:yes gene_type:complete